MSDKWQENLTDEQKKALDEIVTAYGYNSSAAGVVRRAFTRKPREWHGWVGAVALDTPGDSVFSPTDKGRGWIRVRVTEIMDDEEAQP